MLRVGIQWLKGTWRAGPVPLLPCRVLSSEVIGPCITAAGHSPSPFPGADGLPRSRLIFATSTWSNSDTGALKSVVLKIMQSLYVLSPEYIPHPSSSPAVSKPSSPLLDTDTSFPCYISRPHLHTIAEELLEKVDPGTPLPHLPCPTVLHERWAESQTPSCGLQGLTHPSAHVESLISFHTVIFLT